MLKRLRGCAPPWLQSTVNDAPDSENPDRLDRAAQLAHATKDLSKFRLRCRSVISDLDHCFHLHDVVLPDGRKAVAGPGVLQTVWARALHCELPQYFDFRLERRHGNGIGRQTRVFAIDIDQRIDLAVNADGCDPPMGRHRSRLDARIIGFVWN
jgi:hypothetical protein